MQYSIRTCAIWVSFPGQLRDAPSRSLESILQVLDLIWTLSFKIGMKLYHPLLGTYRCPRAPKRDKEKKFSWILTVAMSTIEIVQPSLSQDPPPGSPGRRGKRKLVVEPNWVSRSALKSARIYTTVGNLPHRRRGPVNPAGRQSAMLKTGKQQKALGDF